MCICIYTLIKINYMCAHNITHTHTRDMIFQKDPQKRSQKAQARDTLGFAVDCCGCSTYKLYSCNSLSESTLKHTHTHTKPNVCTYQILHVYMPFCKHIYHFYTLFHTRPSITARRYGLCKRCSSYSKQMQKQQHKRQYNFKSFPQSCCTCTYTYNCTTVLGASASQPKQAPLPLCAPS